MKSFISDTFILTYTGSQRQQLMEAPSLFSEKRHRLLWRAEKTSCGL